MRKLALALSLSLVLPGCAAIKDITNAYTFVTTATVSPSTILIAANSFDGLEGTATNYFDHCRANLSEAICSAPNRRFVIKAVRSGRAARDKLETYITSSTPAPASIYNSLIAAITSLRTAPLGAAK